MCCYEKWIFLCILNVIVLTLISTFCIILYQAGFCLDYTYLAPIRDHCKNVLIKNCYICSAKYILGCYMSDIKVN